MPGQLELLERPALQLQPEAGRTEPRLWVRRLVVWSKPGIIVRQVPLHPGLNIVWSPDPADREGRAESGGALGHGSGKTLFCRLVRYCLGEDHFAPEGLRARIFDRFKSGLVGAEVIVDGTPWAVVRCLGPGRRDVCVPNGNLDEIAAGEADATGMAPFLAALETGLLSDAVAALLPGERGGRSWLIALAWLARDQECHFADVLNWRSSATDSGSPARGLSATKTLDALRALIGAIDPKEHELRSKLSEIERSCAAAEKLAGHREWEAGQTRKRLAAELGMNGSELLPGSMAIEPLRKVARQKLASIAVVQPGGDIADLDALRAESEEARKGVDALARELAEVDARIPEIERLVSRIKGELPGLSFSADEAEHPVCPICEVPIDRVLAAGCKLSHNLTDLAEVKKRRAQRQRELEEEARRLAGARRRKDEITSSLADQRQHAEALRVRLHAAERLRDARNEAWYTARRLLDEVERLAELHLELERAKTEVREIELGLEKIREQTTAYRDAQARVFRRASQVFDFIIRKLVGSSAGATGQVTLDGNGIHLTVKMGGERSTAAIDSLKVLAFDLTALWMSMEGATALPAFVIHDSPREADLGLSPYHQLFQFVRSLEEAAKQPIFQYIVTTTTKPPDALCRKPWLVLELHGAPAEERLLGIDL